jgi:hypothetical protein
MTKNKILDYIKALSLFLCLSLPVFAHPEGDVSLSNGGQLNQSINYQHISSVNNGITFSQAQIMTFDYIISAGIVTSFSSDNNEIAWGNLTLDNKPLISGSTVAATVVDIGITFTTSNGNIRQIKYTVSQELNNMNDKYTVVYSSWDADVLVGPSIQISTTTDKLEKGINYIQWYAQNTVNTTGLETGIFIIYVNDSRDYVKIIQPGQIASQTPVIRAEVHSAYGFNESSVTVQLFPGSSTNTTSIYNKTGEGKIKSKDGKRFLEYTYDGPTLTDRGKYTLSVKFTDSKNNVIGPQLLTFSIDYRPVAQLLPYPSPYNPNSGKPMKIKYVLNEAASVTINIYDRSGKFISKVLDKFSGVEGENYTEWDIRSYAGDSLANGIYICEIITNNGKENRRYRSFAILRK